MPDLLQTGLAWLHRQRETCLTSPAAYFRRDAETSQSVSVTASQVRRQFLDAEGIPVYASVMDFIMNSESLALPPEAGDRIEFNGRRYEVAPLDDDRCWRWTDQSRLAVRIHTRDIGAIEP